LTGRILFLITGSHTGLGLETAVHLARLNPVQFILVVRGVKKGDLGEAAKAQIISRTNYAGLIEVWGL
jgi:NAD(P)-dependent dehydrogenase (short-subunit alcohol dehydrogenase family)